MISLWIDPQCIAVRGLGEDSSAVADIDHWVYRAMGNHERLLHITDPLFNRIPVLQYEIYWKPWKAPLCDRYGRTERRFQYQCTSSTLARDVSGRTRPKRASPEDDRSALRHQPIECCERIR